MNKGATQRLCVAIQQLGRMVFKMLCIGGKSLRFCRQGNGEFYRGAVYP